MCNHRSHTHRSVGCPRVFCLCRSQQNQHGDLAKCHHCHHKVTSSQVASPRALGLPSAPREAAPPGLGPPEPTHVPILVHRAWVQAVWRHRLRERCEESSYRVHQEAHDNPPRLDHQGSQSLIVPSEEKSSGQCPSLAGSSVIGLLSMRKEKDII